MAVINCVIAEQASMDANTVTISERLWPTLTISNGKQVVYPGQNVRVRVNKETRYLSVYSRGLNTDGNELFVKSGTFKIPQGEKPAATIEKVPPGTVRLNLIFKTRDGILSLIGLVLAIGGTVAQAVNSSQTTPSILWIVIASVALVVGLLLVFFRGVWNLAPS